MTISQINISCPNLSPPFACVLVSAHMPGMTFLATRLSNLNHIFKSTSILCVYILIPQQKCIKIVLCRTFFNSKHTYIWVYFCWNCSDINVQSNQIICYQKHFLNLVKETHIFFNESLFTTFGSISHLLALKPIRYFYSSRSDHSFIALFA